jgi:citrate synthase
MASLKETLAGKIPPLRDEIRAILKKHGGDKIADVSVAQAYGGMRGIKCMVTETSALDPNEGIRFRGYSIPEASKALPKAPGGEEPLPEGIFYLLLTGDLPSESDVREISAEWRRRETLPDYAKATLDALPRNTHPMTQFSIGIMALQRESVFARRYREGIPKAELWEPMYEDAMNLAASLPLVASYVYRRTYKNGEHIPPADKDLDWGANFAHMLGYEEHEFQELLRLYLVLHCDHEGGNVSAHTIHLVGSAFSDAYLSLAAGMNGLAGPLHGLANQEVLRWIMEARDKLGGVPTKDQLHKFCWDTLNGGKVIPGFGHAVLRKTDPRYTAQREFAQKHLPEDDIFQIVSLLYEVVPPILEEQGKAKNPWPNVDAHSGCLLNHYGMKEYDYYTVLFGVSRALGTLSSLVWDRGLGLALERPKSVTTDWIKQQVKWS